ncbi:T9SS type A sorting domain-containing protein [Flavobacterium sp. AS60]|uniref:T9SS type A sorting domain-containing protein n=1 Tax=Flavobacterium anseongense TaxID=2910677 RepID=UPI001F3C80F5|nr:T9SS type A sorting domain-containing protein [Flavobacterium sp. AS60]MCF6128512.1 T9SS type A sorting domain-containing protein [Flavobacterium sp. AS60]
MKKLLLLFTFLYSNFIIGQSIISVSPNNGNRGQQYLTVSITTQDVTFSVASPQVDVSFIDQFSNVLPANWAYSEFNNTIWANLSIPAYAAPGLYDVRLVEVGGVLDITLPDGFTVNNQYTYTIQGNVRYDSNNNGCDASDINIPNQRITFTNGSTTGNLIADQTGFYNYYDVQAGNNSFSPVLANPTYFTVSPPSASVTLSTLNNLFVQDFCISANGTHNDLEIGLVPVTSARPGFDATYRLTYKNKGTHVQNGTVSFNFDDNVMDLITATPAIDSQGTNTLNWNFSNLMPFEIRQILVTMNINSPAETPPVNAGNGLLFSATVSGATDETPSDNTANLNQTVVGSYDPNDKTCLQGNFLPIGNVGTYLNYVIRFENTGTANAETVVVRDLIDTSKFDINTLTPVSGSHSFTTKITNTNLVEFIFENINLPFDDANNDGYVAFKIKTKPTLTVGANISNTANIYFDYNLPVITNTATTAVYNPLITNDFEFGSMFTLSPVPAKNNLTITIKQDVTISSVNIYNTLGQLIQVSSNPSETIDVSSLKTGTYFIKILSDRGTASSKFIKE